jgi:hypothetical protein
MCEWHIAAFFFPNLKVKSKILDGHWTVLHDLWAEQWGPMKIPPEEQSKTRHLPSKDCAEFFWLRE